MHPVFADLARTVLHGPVRKLTQWGKQFSEEAANIESRITVSFKSCFRIKRLAFRIGRTCRAFRFITNGHSQFTIGIGHSGGQAERRCILFLFLENNVQASPRFRRIAHLLQGFLLDGGQIHAYCIKAISPKIFAAKWFAGPVQPNPKGTKSRTHLRFIGL